MLPWGNRMWTAMFWLTFFRRNVTPSLSFGLSMLFYVSNAFNYIFVHLSRNLKKKFGQCFSYKSNTFLLIFDVYFKLWHVLSYTRVVQLYFVKEWGSRIVTFPHPLPIWMLLVVRPLGNSIKEALDARELTWTGPWLIQDLGS